MESRVTAAHLQRSSETDKPTQFPTTPSFLQNRWSCSSPKLQSPTQAFCVTPEFQNEMVQCCANWRRATKCRWNTGQAAGFHLLITDEARDNRNEDAICCLAWNRFRKESPSDFSDQTNLRAAHHLQSICGMRVWMPMCAYVCERGRQFKKNFVCYLILGTYKENNKARGKRASVLHVTIKWH